MTHYFAYGSNMDSRRLEQRGIVPRAARSGILNNYSLRFNKRSSKDCLVGFANIEQQSGGRVEGVVYEVGEGDLGKLDGYEGVTAGHYRRLTVRVKLEDGTRVEAVTYQACESRSGSGLKPTRGYIAHLLAGRRFLSTSYLKELEQTETID